MYYSSFQDIQKTEKYQIYALNAYCFSSFLFLIEDSEDVVQFLQISVRYKKEQRDHFT